MPILFQLMEYMSTILESILIFWTCSLILPSQNKLFPRVLLCGIINCVIVTLLNRVDLFSFITVLIAFFLYFVSIRWSFACSWRLAVLSVVFSFLFLHSIDYIFNFLIPLLLTGSFSPSESFDLTLNPTVYRSLYIIICDTIQWILLLILRPWLRKIPSLPVNSQRGMIIIFSIFYLAISSVIQLVLSESAVLQQVAVMLLNSFILISSICVIYAMNNDAQYRSAKRELDLIHSTGETINQAYVLQSEALKLAYKQSHDHERNIKTILGLVDSPAELKDYVSDLLGSSPIPKTLCSSGDPYVDAIINCKLAEAALSSIHLEYFVNLPGALPFDPVDISSLLSNQIDNALHACKRLPETDDRTVHIEIYKDKSFYLFRVENPYDPSLPKENQTRHGFGTEIMTQIVERYEGAIEMRPGDHHFTCVALLQEA